MKKVLIIGTVTAAVGSAILVSLVKIGRSNRRVAAINITWDKNGVGHRTIR